MKKKSLFDTNPYLQDRNKYRKALIMSVASSTSIETGIPLNTIRNQLTALTGDANKKATK
jgi:hypothetical protein